MDTSKKCCARCKIELPLTSFPLRKVDGRTYHKSYCRPCLAAEVRERYRLKCGREVRFRASDSRFEYVNGLLRTAKYRAKKLGVPFNLTLQDISIPEVCPVLGIPLKKGERVVAPNSPSLDRFVPSLGYVRGNVAIISQRANAIKNDGTPEEIMKVALWTQKVSLN